MNTTTEAVISDPHTTNTKKQRPHARQAVAMFLIAITASLGVMTGPATPAAAATNITTFDTSCSQGNVRTWVGMTGGQYVSLQFKFLSPLGYTSYSAWQTPFWAPQGGTTTQWSQFTPGWRGATAVYVRVTYWNGSRWYYTSGYGALEQDAWSCIV